MFVLPQGCTPPLTADCAQLQITPRWAIACFKPAYHRLRNYYGNNVEGLIEALMAYESNCGDAPMRGAQHELHRRIVLAVAVLMNREGVPVTYPPTAQFPRPSQADAITQPWLRALLTGWL